MNIHDDRFISIVFSHATCSHVFDDSNNLSYICYSEEGSVGKQQSLPWNPRVWINIADISNDINAFGVAYPISVSICTLLLFLKRIIDSRRSRPSNENSCISIIQFEQFLHEYSHPISISETRSIWNYFSKRLKQNIQNNDKWNRWSISFFLLFFFPVSNLNRKYWKIPFSWISREDWANMISSNEKRELGVDRHEAY